MPLVPVSVPLFSGMRWECFWPCRRVPGRERRVQGNRRVGRRSRSADQPHAVAAADAEQLGTREADFAGHLVAAAADHLALQHRQHRGVVGRRLAAYPARLPPRPRSGSGRRSADTDFRGRSWRACPAPHRNRQAVRAGSRSWSRRSAKHRHSAWPVHSRFSADQGAEQLGVAQQVHIANVLLADVGMRGLPHPRRLPLVAEQEADCRSECRQVGGIGQQDSGAIGDLVDDPADR
jgi:hypothetical protein